MINKFEELITRTIEEAIRQNQVFYKLDVKKITSSMETFNHWENSEKFEFGIFCLGNYLKLSSPSNGPIGTEVSKKYYVYVAFSKFFLKNYELNSLKDINAVLKHFSLIKGGLFEIIYYPWSLELLIKNIDKNYNKGQDESADVENEILDNLLLLRKNILNDSDYDYVGVKLTQVLNYILELHGKIKGSFNIGIYVDEDEIISKYLREFFTKNDPSKVEKIIKTLLIEKDKSSPSLQWLKSMKIAVSDFGEMEYQEFAFDLLRECTENLNQYFQKEIKIPFEQKVGALKNISYQNELLVRSVLWSLANYTITERIASVHQFSLTAYKKLPYLGTLQPKLGNATLYLISLQEFNIGMPILKNIESKIKYAPGLKLIEKYIINLAVKSGKTKEQLEDENVPTFGLGLNGQSIHTFGSIEASINVQAYNQVEVAWSIDGKNQKSVPALIKSDFAEDLKSFNKNVKDIKETLSLLVKRFESFFTLDRSWNYEEWQAVIQEHPLVSKISSLLIWEFTNGSEKISGLYINNQMINQDANPVQQIDKNTVVTLWHPIHYAASQIKKWRDLLIKHQIVQPFKQAYREVYLLTDAEANTVSYSNRFAAHILKNYQFGALCTLRNWKGYNQFHDGGVPQIEFKKQKITVQYWVDFVQTDNWGDYITTDQVKFLGPNGVMNLVDVPKIIFSEAMRDVDLFVGVCSVGNDPNWIDGGSRFGHDYWQSYSFGNLSEIAKTRKEILTNLIPKLKIAKVCSIDGNFLVVIGKIRTYKIHIGSTNILMEPNDQYLCIVQDRTTSAKNLFIPFEGDNGLSVIISKAFLLADDDKISDSTIISQLKMR